MNVNSKFLWIPPCPYLDGYSERLQLFRLAGKAIVCLHNTQITIARLKAFHWCGWIGFFATVLLSAILAPDYPAIAFILSALSMCAAILLCCSRNIKKRSI